MRVLPKPPLSKSFKIFFDVCIHLLLISAVGNTVTLCALAAILLYFLFPTPLLVRRNAFPVLVGGGCHARHDDKLHWWLKVLLRRNKQHSATMTYHLRGTRHDAHLCTQHWNTDSLASDLDADWKSYFYEYFNCSNAFSTEALLCSYSGWHVGNDSTGYHQQQRHGRQQRFCSLVHI